MLYLSVHFCQNAAQKPCFPTPELALLQCCWPVNKETYGYHGTAKPSTCGRNSLRKASLPPFPLARLPLGALPSIIFFAFFHHCRAYSQAIAKPEGPLLGAITPRFGLFQEMSLYMYFLTKVMARNRSKESDPEVEASLTEHFL